jgi:uncharacterized membrane protein HdeD (DUF308 family)
MSVQRNINFNRDLRFAVENGGVQLRHKGRWCVQIGVALLILGLLAMGAITVTAPNPVILVGWLMVVAGLVEGVHAFHLRNSSAFFFHLVPAIAGFPIGILMVTHPAVGSMAWMLVFASSFTVIGLFRLIAAFRLKFSNWQSSAIDGVATSVLGAVFWTTATWLSPWYFCLATGSALILRGWASIMFGLGLSNQQRTRPARTQEAQRAKSEAYVNRFLQRRSN